MKILEGMTSMLSLAESNDRHLAAFLESTTVTREGERVVLRLDYSAARLVEMVTNLRQSATAPEPREVKLVTGQAITEWTAHEGEENGEGLSYRTIENVPLTTGVLINFGRAPGAPRNVRFERVEITPTAGGPPLVFRPDFMRHRGAMLQMPFPGADGTYTLRVGYVYGQEKNARLAVGLEDPKPSSANQPGRSKTPAARQPSSK